jgi:hypothetical protein
MVVLCKGFVDCTTVHMPDHARAQQVRRKHDDRQKLLLRCTGKCRKAPAFGAVFL